MSPVLLKPRRSRSCVRTCSFAELHVTGAGAALDSVGSPP